MNSSFGSNAVFFIKVAICAGCYTVYPWAGFVIGSFAGVVFMVWSFMMEKLRIDDPLDAVAGIIKHLELPKT